MKSTSILGTILFMFTLFNCNVENIEKYDNAETPESFDHKGQIDFKVYESGNSNSEDLNEHCKTVNLIAGKNHVAGTVTIDVDGDNLIVSYVTNNDWNLEETHLSISSCEEGGFPTTNSGNPKIGKFAYSSSHSNEIKEVTYTISLADITDEFCFAAHAVVNGATQETAWAEGTDFGGNSWAMYVEATLSECEYDDIPVGGRG